MAEHAVGVANLDTGEKLTRHRFRIASHSKSFTSAGILKLREQRRLKLDDVVGQYVSDLHSQVAEATITQLLSHSAGLTRDGADSGQFIDTRQYLSTTELLAELKRPAAIEPNTRFKYSNHGFALLGLVIEAVTKGHYPVRIKREIVDAVGLEETVPNMPLSKGTPFAPGHTRRQPLGRRLVIPGDNSANAMTSAAGFVATAADTACFFAQLAPGAKKSVISQASRREMTRRHWRVPGSIELHYGLGLACGKSEGFDWFGHGGGFQGYLSRTAVRADSDVAVTILSNSIDGWAPFWMEGCFHILRAFQDARPARAAPARLGRPLVDDLERDRSRADGQPSAGRQSASDQPVHGFERDRNFGPRPRPRYFGSRLCQFRRAGAPLGNKKGKVVDLWLDGSNFKPEKVLAAEMERKYTKAKNKARG